MMEKIKVSCVQFSYKPISNYKDFEKNVEKLIEQAKGSHFVVFPETFTLELQYIIPNHDLSKISDFTEKYISLFTNLSQKYYQYIIAGTHLVKENDKEYNISHLFCPDGNIFKHRKTHLFPLELQMGVVPGDTLEIFETEFGKIGISICYEMEFPEAVRILTLKGAEIIFCPSYTVGEHGFWRVRHCCQARAIENQIYVIHSCMVGSAPLGGLEGYGKSSILSPCELPWNPNGIIVEAEANKEMIISSELDIKLLHKKRNRSAAPTLKDRRPEIYNL
ncbi:MAG: amidohydrolase [Candidatus Lokiarchaeota archaeon]|nr:amidohydrolase [Candidatus Lokiarchaeota archaeon]